MSSLHDRDGAGLLEKVEQLSSIIEKQEAIIGVLIDSINKLSAELTDKASHQDVMTAIGEYVPSELRGSSIDGSGDILVNMGGKAVWDTIETATESSSGSFTGVYYFKGKRYKLGGTAKAYWYHNEATGAAAWSDGPFPDPMPDMMYWRTTSECGPVEYIMC